ncbi:hypothetical protein GCM10010145_07160 [Streptomyces ruber]|uniref:Uncharacterized protein n=1 Tax=Streptomyces ruber TaxID=83378 RepID=A0A918B7U4_9ACTN|nr:hypothetical protein [Streptomyces ruber]GGQ41403.1 hypothetical protein GCM10010145_07160 [Streptomyces ruber]
MTPPPPLLGARQSHPAPERRNDDAAARTGDGHDTRHVRLRDAASGRRVACAHVPAGHSEDARSAV